MNDGTIRLDGDHQTLAKWASKQLENIIDFMSKEQIDQFLNQNISKNTAELEVAFSELLDMTNDASKKFVQDWLLRKSKIESLQAKKRQLEEDAKRKNLQKKKQKMEEIKSSNREMCHCQAMVHDLVSNCTGCGRIVWAQEGEGDCLFCGAYVESHLLPPEEDKVDPGYMQALEKRNRLLEFDKSEVMGAGIKDQSSDWYELENNVWQTKEQREFAKMIREAEEKKNKEEEEAVYVKIGGGKDFVSMSKGEVKSREQMSQEANKYINELAADHIKSNVGYDENEVIKESFKDIRIQSCQFLDDKSRELIQKLKKDAARAEQELIERAKYQQEKEETDPDILSMQRLQTENPFEEFQREFEKALKRKAEEKAEEMAQADNVEATRS